LRFLRRRGKIASGWAVLCGEPPTTTQEDTVSDQEKRRSEEAEVEAHRSRATRTDEAAEKTDPEKRAGESREDGPDVEAHRMQRGRS
jgi:hypothetical protein